MSGLQLDTSGSVPMDIVHGVRFDGVNMAWSDLSPFTQGYIEALFADQLPVGWFFRDLAPETLARIIADCEARKATIGSPLKAVWLGREFWNVRCVGAYPAAFPPLTVQLGGDGKVRFAAITRADGGGALRASAAEGAGE